MRPVTPGAAGATPSDAGEAKLRQVVSQMEGVFVEQLYKAMRATVPEGGALSGGAGEEMFTGLLDQHLAAETPKEWQRGLGEALYRHLRVRLGEPGAPAAQPAASGPTGTLPAAQAPTPDVARETQR
jgi:flagellar protein FlgJ